MSKHSEWTSQSGRRWHFLHGPIHLIVSVDDGSGPKAKIAHAAASTRFSTLLEEIVTELPFLQTEVRIGGHEPIGRVARRMYSAVIEHAGRHFVTPMASVAGSVADEILSSILEASDPRRIFVNNGGDIAVALSEGEIGKVAVFSPAGHELGRFVLNDSCGVATSGLGGRSFSCGIADAVTATACDAAAADAAATLIANAVDLPDHPAIIRQKASDKNPESDLGSQLVVVKCGRLTEEEIEEALDSGQSVAADMQERGLISSAVLFFRGRQRLVGIKNGCFAPNKGVIMDG